MAFKILTVLLVACVAQNIAFAASLPVDKPITQNQEIAYISNVLGVQTFGNPLACMPHLYDLWNAVQEIKGLFAEFGQIRNRNKDLKKDCPKLPTEPQIEECLKKADDATQNEMNGLIKKVKEFVPKAVKLVQNFKKCLFD